MTPHLVRRSAAVVLVSLMMAVGISSLATRSLQARATTVAWQFHGFAVALSRVIPADNNVTLPVTIRVWISEVDHSWAYGSWRATFHDNGTYTKTLYLTEEYAHGAYRHFGTGFVSPYCPKQMPSRVCIGHFRTMTIVLK